MTSELQTLNSLPVSAAIIDRNGVIVGVNEAWKEFGRRNGLCLPNFGVGASYISYCQDARCKSYGVGRELMELLSGERDLVMNIYPCDSPTSKRWFMLLAFPLAEDKSGGIAMLHADLSGIVPLPSASSSSNPESAQDTAAQSGLATIASSLEASVTMALAAQLQSMMRPAERPEPSLPDVAEDVPEVALATSRLSKRQLEILKLLGEGKTNAEIADKLLRSPHTIKLHVSAILRTLNLKSRTQAALLASKLPKSG